MTDNNKKELRLLGEKIGQLNLAHGSAGNLSIRIADKIYMTISGSDITALQNEDICILDNDGRLIEGGKPSKELPLHMACYKRNPKTNAVIHLHAPKAMAVSCLSPWSEKSAVPPVSPYFVMRVGATPLLSYAPPSDVKQAEEIRNLPQDVDALLLQNHGLVVTGKSADTALERTIELEDSCALYLDVKAHQPRYLSDEECYHLSNYYGSYWP